ncbi:pantoate--beta-alanine ligase [Anoxynatronum buryatiense]|uniref:Pantothenate synthetase n=1 Tax=Anoxynatronum buryatiense TaxID=489973 RepID=A0AA45WXY7_9CLOT|nr:pantoate--beta-alanine ligase [Anoxynatronum buryatiense]SMP66650.1 pantothenate synthetase [Anoxynatronum buryatiense]
MKKLENIEKMQQFSFQARKKSHIIGLVPTMGALHQGHLSLIQAARQECHEVVVSIFVNPTQFGENEDYERYPRDWNQDCSLAAAAGATAVFLPSASDIYPPSYQTTLHLDSLTQHLCGAHRPGHFDAVATVVCKLLNIVAPHRAYFGQKDVQQLRVIQQMTADLNMNVGIVPMPTLRESDGLAMSSRNAYLSPSERLAAGIIYQALLTTEQAAQAGETSPLILQQLLLSHLVSEPLVHVEYAAVADPVTLTPLEQQQSSMLLAVAVRIGDTRLIDNLLINLPSCAGFTK